MKKQVRVKRDYKQISAGAQIYIQSETDTHYTGFLPEGPCTIFVTVPKKICEEAKPLDSDPIFKAKIKAAFKSATRLIKAKKKRREDRESKHKYVLTP